MDVCFAASEPLAESRRKINTNTFLALHGVDHEFFSSALDPATSLPADVSEIARPIIGFFGAVKDHVDLLLVQDMAKRHESTTPGRYIASEAH